MIDKTLDSSSQICEVHNIPMKKTIVKAWYGTPANWSTSNNEPEYKNAKEKIYLGGVRTSESKSFARIYYCKECTRIKKEGKKK